MADALPNALADAVGDAALPAGDDAAAHRIVDAVAAWTAVCRRAMG
jgi:hypothetical protein